MESPSQGDSVLQKFDDINKLCWFIIILLYMPTLYCPVGTLLGHI